MCNGASFTVFMAALLPALAAAYDLADAVSKLPQSQLEKTFWECDFRGTHGMVYGDDGAYARPSPVSSTNEGSATITSSSCPGGARTNPSRTDSLRRPSNSHGREAAAVEEKER
jgi:hypothetical protein